MYYPKALKYVALFGRRGGATAAEEENEGSEPSPLQIKARELALAAWRADVEVREEILACKSLRGIILWPLCMQAIGELNKVAQAIKVEYEHPLKNAIIKSALEKNSNKNESKSKGSSRNRESGRQDVQEEASSESDSEDDDNDSAGPVPGLDAEASDSEVEEGPSVNAVPAKMLQNKSFGNETKNESSKKRKRDQESKPGDVAPTYEPDAFFVEEATEANDDAVFPQPVRNNHVGRGRGGSYNQGYFTPSLTKDSRSKAVSSAEVSGLSKQEARLRMWQQGKRGGHRGPGRAGLSRAASGAQGPDDVREQQGHHRTVDSGSSFRGRGGSSGRGGRGRSRVGDGAGRGGNQEAGPASRGDSRAYPRYLTPPSTNYSAPKKVQLDAAPNNKKIKFTE